ncbi:DNA polymerase III subunit alpha [Magnetospirillum molischianum]|uniref:DNA polymerase III subunit alpha n=1 Tax=Magnetospirillum molischianum DSM 120 TaxID=1150626 RepID=H8FY91_MAGML|nr:DNA polymerase III subunit alpha [Magnetospirillum molischianum]CCG43329.1 putative DNA polymerase III subunit alpha [Magnetospirillum molischianum DSM 120]
MPLLIGARSHFSIGESTLQVKDVVKHAKALGYSGVALADTMTVSGLVELTSKCKEEGLKPIIGARLRIVDDPTYKKPARSSGEKAKDNREWYPKLFARTEEGLRRIMRLLTLANSEDRFYQVARLGFDDLMRELIGGGDHLIFTSGDAWGAFHHPGARDMLREVSGRLGASQTFLELAPVATPLFDTLNHHALVASAELNLPTLVSYPAFYQGGGADTLDVLSAISRNVKIADRWAFRPASRDHHARKLADLIGLIKGAKDRIEARYPGLDQAGWKEGLVNQDSFAELVGYTWEKMPVSLPKIADDEFAKLVEECKEGWKRRFSRPAFGHRPNADELAETYHPRLKYELGVLRDMGFAGYFLVVQDLVMWSKRNGIAVGPGRGSVGGSLVAYLLGITDVDPIRFGLLFERFINPERLDLPDADLDFMSTRRHEVVAYLVERYGEDKVAGISNYAVLQAASAIRDVGRVTGLTDDDMRATKLMPKEHGQPVPLERAVTMVPEIESFVTKHPAIYGHAIKLEGVMRTLGRHAAGIVIAGEPLVNRAVVERRKDGATVNWDKRVCEDFGLVKMDILGLSTLDVLELAREQIFRLRGKKIDFFDLQLDDPKVLENFARGNTVGVFQFESGGMRKLLKDLGASGTITFEEITAATALYRPGPMDAGLKDQFVEIKQGIRSESYDHPKLMPALRETFGVIVYQEQVMQAAVDLAGFTKADADHLRKAMGKKDKEKMAKQRDKWVRGCVDNSGMSEEEAGRLFDQIEVFAGYAFNKSHSVEYTLISYISMWLKTYYPAEFYAAALTVQSQSTSQDRENKLASLLKDAGKNGIEVIAPDINVSSDRFEILNDAILCIPFNALKGISDNTAGAILKARESGPFKDVDDFLARVEKRKCNIRHQDILRRVGAFARIEPGSLPANHPDRLKDQMELMPGLVSRNIKADRDIDMGAATVEAIKELVREYRAVDDGIHPKPFLGKRSKFMVIADAPNWAEEKHDQITAGDGFAYVEEAMTAAGLVKSDGYWTTLVKAPKREKQLTNDEINTYVPFLHREIEILKPPVIVCLGSAVAKHFLGALKGGIMDHAGKVIFDPTLDASIVVGINPGMIKFDPAKQTVLNDVFKSVADMVSD